MCIPVQSAEAGEKLSTSMLPLRKPDGQDTVNLSEPDDIGLHIESQVDRGSHKVLSSETSPVCHSNSKFSLGVRFREIHASTT